MRGRIMALMIAEALGGQPLSAPLLGWIADSYGPRAVISIAAAKAIGAATIGLRAYLCIRNSPARELR